MGSLTALLFAQSLTLTLGDTTDLRGRWFEDDTSYDAITTPFATLQLDDRRTSYSLSYQPSVSVLNIGEEDSETVLFNTLSFDATARFRNHTLTLTQQLDYGRRNFRYEAVPGLETGLDEPTDGPPSGAPDELAPGQVEAQDTTVEFGASRTIASLSHQLTRQLTLSEFAGYEVSAGLGESRTEYPLQRGVLAGSNLGYGLTRRDVLTTEVTGSVFHTEPDVETIVVTLSESWAHEFSEDLRVSGGAGVAYGRTTTPEGTLETLTVAVGPIGDASIEYNWGSSGANYSLLITGGIAPEINRFNGIVDPRALWTVLLSRTEERLTLTAAGAGAHSINTELTPTPISTFGASVGAEYQWTDELVLRAGGSVSVQALDINVDELPPPLWIAFVGLSYSSLPFRL